MIPAIYAGIGFTIVAMLIGTGDIKGMSNKNINRLTAAIVVSTFCGLLSFAIALFSL